MACGVLPWIYPVWDSLGFLDLGDYFLPHFSEVFNYYLPKYFSWSFFLSSSGTPMIRMLGGLSLSQRSLMLSSFFFNSFFLYVSFISTILSSTSLILSSASVILLLVPSRSHLLHYSLYIDFFISSRSLLYLSCIFLILVSRLFICNPNLFSRFWIIFTIIIQNSLSGRFPISSSFVWWAFILLLYLLGIYLPFNLVYIAVFGVAFLYSGSWWLLFIVEVPSCGWSWTSSLSRFSS